MSTGYLHERYARSLADFGSPCLLQGSGGWILKRRIGQSGDYDAMGIYPLFLCRNWSNLRNDLEEAGRTLVSLALVTDPFGGYDIEYLRLCFRDVVIPFKEHFVVDLRTGGDLQPHSRHRNHVRRAMRNVIAEPVQDLARSLDDWSRLYRMLCARHSIRGVAAFSRYSFEQQLQVPGMTAFRAVHRTETVGMTLWYRHDDLAYYHLGAYSETGYALHASYALFACAIALFREAGLRWLNLGAGAGVRSDANDGLSQFKRGWSTGTRTAFFCGRIFDRERYGALAGAHGDVSSSYFPAYRTGDFA